MNSTRSMRSRWRWRSSRRTWRVRSRQARHRQPANRPRSCGPRRGIERHRCRRRARRRARRNETRRRSAGSARWRPAAQPTNSALVLLAQQVLLHLAHRVARQFGDDEHALGHLEVGDAAPSAPRSSPRRRAPRRACATTTATTASPKSGCGTPITADLGHAGHLVDAALDLGRIDVVAAADDQVLAAPDDASRSRRSSILPTSPVLNQQSVVNSSAVFSGMRQ